MDVLLKSLTQHAPSVTLALCICLFLSVVGLVSIWLKQRRHESKWRALLSDSRGDTLETLLYDHLRERMQLDERLMRVDGRLSELEERMLGAKRFLGLVRYDAFPDVAGNQSFALAVYDDRGDGAVLSSIVGRTTCRVYCKPLIGGRSERDLSQEEQRAIRDAREGGVRTILSP